MTVEQLIKQLEKMPKNAKVFHLWNGEPRTEINLVYECKSGQVITADFDQYCYSKNARPKNVSSRRSVWKTKSNPKGYNEYDDFKRY
jgi:hypothetical protein